MENPARAVINSFVKDFLLIFIFVLFLVKAIDDNNEIEKHIQNFKNNNKTLFTTIW